MDFHITCKYEEDMIKTEGARVLTTLFSNFSDAQGQITLELVVVSGRNLNSFKLLCMSSLPARMRMIESKMKDLESSQDFSHCYSMGIFPDAQGQLTRSPWSDLAEFRTRPRCYRCSRYLQV